MKQNIYDDPEFFVRYSILRETQSGLNEVLEQPAMQSLFPPVTGLRVLDLGCGAGQLCRELREQGVLSVTGVDISANMLALAHEKPHDGILYLQQAIEDFTVREGSYDLVVSSLALHYVQDYPHVVRRVAGWLSAGGYFIFSIEHPIATAAQGIHPGWVRDGNGHKQYWAVDCYQEEGLRQSRWFIPGVQKYHRTVATTINVLIENDFTICTVLEPHAEEWAERERPDLLEERRRPPFLLIKALHAG